MLHKLIGPEVAVARIAETGNNIADSIQLGVYRSSLDPRLTVVRKANGGKADALNCGINFARYRYLCCVDGDTMFAPDAVLKAMSLVVKDPERIVAAASLFGISLVPEEGHGETTGPRQTNGHMLGDFQHLDLMRAFVAYRLAWSRLIASSSGRGWPALQSPRASHCGVGA